MPTIVLFQPEPGEEQAPLLGWDFRFVPQGADGRPDYAQMEALGYTVGNEVYCDGEMMRSYCQRTVEAIEGEPLGVYRQRIDACTEEVRVCDTVVVDAPIGAGGWIQAQSIGESIPEVRSEWSNAVVVPEPSVESSLFLLLLGAMLVGIVIVEYSRIDSWSRTLSEMRIKRQRSAVFRRVRKVLRRVLRMVGVRKC